MCQLKIPILGDPCGALTKLWIWHHAAMQLCLRHITVASAQSVSKGVQHVTPIFLDVTDENALDAEVGKHDLVISLIQHTFHAIVNKSAIRQKKHVVTTNYVSPAMTELDRQGEDADSGIDHLYAVRTVEEVHKAGPKILTFFWSSRGCWKDGKAVDVASKDLMGIAKPYFLYPSFAFVAYPNRDSTPYKEGYNIPEGQTIIRSILLYQGFPEFIRVLVEIGVLGDAEQDVLKQAITWKEATDLESAIVSKPMFDSPEEKTRILSAHKFEIENKDGRREGYSAMAKLVGIPCGVAVKQVLDGTISDVVQGGKGGLALA
ncbi:Saccharopine dehydrogenase [Hypoxylon sp. NC0597]|nr:Saccharopine dehydrogenase [Hypoxylon sp. NC0597]